MHKAIIIGGSAGSFQVITKILSALPKNYPIPVLMCMHRLKHVRKGFVETLNIRSNLPVTEPYDKQLIKSGKAYLAPANYHMYIELGNRIALSTEEVVNHSRPSIDLAFASAANVYREKLIGIILSGANKDGAYGLKKINEGGGITIVQSPETCEIKAMAEAAIDKTKPDYIYSPEQIVNFFHKIIKS